MNSFNVIGRITNDITLEKSVAGNSYTRFSIAENYRRGGDECTNFFDCVAYGKTAELITKYVAKGQRIALTGKIEVGFYDTKDGEKRHYTKIEVSNVTLIEGKPHDDFTETEIVN